MHPTITGPNGPFGVAVEAAGRIYVARGTALRRFRPLPSGVRPTDEHLCGLRGRA